MSTSTSTSVSLLDFTAYDLPAKKWMSLIRPRMRLRVRLPLQKRTYVSSPVKLGERSRRAGVTDFSSVEWPWDDEHFPQPSLADDDVFEVEVERRFLFWYRCIRRTKPSTIDQVRTGDHCALSLYDRRRFTDVADEEERLEIGEITFGLRSEDTPPSEPRVSFMAYA